MLTLAKSDMVNVSTKYKFSWIPHHGHDLNKFLNAVNNYYRSAGYNNGIIIQ